MSSKVLKTREDVAAELQRVRDEVRERALHPRDPAAVLGSPRQAPIPTPVATEDAPPPEPSPPRPDAAAVNEHWRAEGAGRGFLARFLERFLKPRFSAQVEWNARQVRLDNEILDYIDQRFAATHRHYDAVLGGISRHLGEVDERHMILQEELVAHVHDLVRRIDLVLGEGEKNRLGAEHVLREVRARLVKIEERLARG
jgi:hypothetical protein